MNKKTTIILIAVIMVGAFLLRVVPYLSKVFVDGYVNFYDPDSAYHLRLVDYMVHNFPRYLTFDPYAIYPDGGAVGYRPVLTFITAGISLLFGGGNPSQHLIETAAAWLPPVIGVLLIIPVYFLGKYAFGKTSGIVGCALIAIMPTELFARSMVGSFDHHVLEVLLGVCTILFLVIANKTNKPLLGIIAGLFLGLYIWNWIGGMFLAAIIFLWYLISVYLRDSKPQQVFWCFITAFICVIPLLPISTTKLEWALLPMAILPFVFYLCWRFCVRDNIPYKWYLFTISMLLIYTIGLILLNEPKITRILVSQFMSIFWGFGATIMEAQPSSPYIIAWQFGITVAFACIGLMVAFKEKISLLVIVWGIVLCLAMLGQRRWGYYAAVPIALFAGYCLSRVLDNTGNRFKLAVWVMCGFLFLGSLFPGIQTQLKQGPMSYSNWQKAFTWIKNNTPEPMGNSLEYYKPDKKPAYGVLSWWDYGHWCIYYGHRVPLSSNTYQVTNAVGQFLLSQNLEMSEIAIKDLNVRYVILSGDMVKPEGTFYAIYNQTMGTVNGWDKALPGSMAYNLYNCDRLGHWKFIYSVKDIRIYERVD